MTSRSLEGVLTAAGNPVTPLRNLQSGPNVYPGVPPEFTNWRDETQAWQKTCVLFNQSYHMADLALEGPHALKLLTRLGVNSFAGFEVEQDHVANHVAVVVAGGGLLGLFHPETGEAV